MTGVMEGVRILGAPVQFDEEPAVPYRAPESSEPGESILGSPGFEQKAILDLKVRGVLA